MWPQTVNAAVETPTTAPRRAIRSSVASRAIPRRAMITNVRRLASRTTYRAPETNSPSGRWTWDTGNSRVCPWRRSVVVERGRAGSVFFRRVLNWGAIRAPQPYATMTRHGPDHAAGSGYPYAAQRVDVSLRSPGPDPARAFRESSCELRRSRQPLQRATIRRLRRRLRRLFPGEERLTLGHAPARRVHGSQRRPASVVDAAWRSQRLPEGLRLDRHDGRDGNGLSRQ